MKSTPFETSFRLLALAVCATLAGCNSDSGPSLEPTADTSPKDLALNFAAAVGDQTSTCGATYIVGTATRPNQPKSTTTASMFLTFA